MARLNPSRVASSLASASCLVFGLMLCGACSSSSDSQWAPDGGSGGSSGGGSSGGSASGSSGGSSSGSGSGSGSSSSGSSGSGSNSGSGSGGRDAGTPRDAMPPGDDGGGGADGGGGGDDGSAPSNAKESLVWLPSYLGSFSANLQMVTNNPKSFTVVAPDFYDLNFNYMSGPPHLGSNSYDGMSVDQVVQQVHSAGMKITPLMYAGAGNSGTDQGIQNVLSDSPAGTQNNFINGLVMEAQMRSYDGWDLDWEVSNTNYSQYGTQYVKFLTALKAALHAQHMVVSITIGDWYIRQCGSDGLVDLAQIGPSVDRVIIMDYAGTLGSPVASCPAGPPPSQQNCANEFGALMNIMCDVSPSAAVSIGLIEGSGGSGANPFLDQALNDIAAVGFTGVAAWPDASPFLDSANIPNGGTWYSLLANFMSK